MKAVIRVFLLSTTCMFALAQGSTGTNTMRDDKAVLEGLGRIHIDGKQGALKSKTQTKGAPIHVLKQEDKIKLKQAKQLPVKQTPDDSLELIELENDPELDQ